MTQNSLPADVLAKQICEQQDTGLRSWTCEWWVGADSSIRAQSPTAQAFTHLFEVLGALPLMPMKGPCLCVGLQWQEQGWGNVVSAGSAVPDLRVTGSLPSPFPVPLGLGPRLEHWPHHAREGAPQPGWSADSASIHSVPPPENSLGSGLPEHPIQSNPQLIDSEANVIQCHWEGLWPMVL